MVLDCIADICVESPDVVGCGVEDIIGLFNGVYYVVGNGVGIKDTLAVKMVAGYAGKTDVKSCVDVSSWVVGNVFLDNLMDCTVSHMAGHYSSAMGIAIFPFTVH